MVLFRYSHDLFPDFAVFLLFFFSPWLGKMHTFVEGLSEII